MAKVFATLQEVSTLVEEMTAPGVPFEEFQRRVQELRDRTGAKLGALLAPLATPDHAFSLAADAEKSLTVEMLEQVKRSTAAGATLEEACCQLDAMVPPEGLANPNYPTNPS